MLTRYKLAEDPDTGKRFAKMDPDGIFYSVGEVDREIDKRDDLIRRMAGMMKRARPETIKIAGPHADPFDPKFLIGCPFCVTAEQSDEKILTTLEHEDDCPWFEIIKEAEAYATGTHVGGRVPEAKRAGTGPTCHGNEEDAPG